MTVNRTTKVPYTISFIKCCSRIPQWNNRNFFHSILSKWTNLARLRYDYHRLTSYDTLKSQRRCSHSNKTGQKALLPQVYWINSYETHSHSHIALGTNSSRFSMVLEFLLKKFKTVQEHILTGLPIIQKRTDKFDFDHPPTNYSQYLSEKPITKHQHTGHRHD